MKQGISRFCLSALLYWLVATFTGSVFIMPAEIVNLTAFVPPVGGLIIAAEVVKDLIAE